MNSRRFMMLLCGCLLLAGVSVQAEDPQTTFDSLFKEQIEAAKISQPKEDDLKLAEELLDYLEYDDLGLEIRSLLCQSAFELALSAPAGEDIAARAMESMIELGPKYELKARLQLIEVTKGKMRRVAAEDRKELEGDLLELLLELAQTYDRQLMLKEAEATYKEALSVARKVDKGEVARVTALRDALKARETTVLRLNKIKEELASSPTEALAKEAAELYLFHLNLPEEAKLYAGASGDATLQKRVDQTLMEDRSELEDAELAALAMWWYKQTESAPEYNKLAIYQRSHDLLAEAFGRETLTGVSKLRVKLNLQKAEAYLAEHQKEAVVEAEADEADQKEEGKLLGKRVKLIPMVGEMIKGNQQGYRDLDVKGDRLIRRVDSHRSEINFNIDPGDSYTLKFKLFIEQNEAGIVLRLPVDAEREVEVSLLKGETNRVHQNHLKQLSTLQGRIGLEKGAYPVAIKVKRVGNRVNIVVAIGRDVVHNWSGKVDQVEEDWQPRLSIANHWEEGNWVISDMVLEGEIRAKRF